MIRGLENNLKPFIKTIWLEDGNSVKVGNSSQLDRHYNKSENEPEYKMRITMEFCIRTMINSNYDSLLLQTLRDSLSSLELNVLTFDDETMFKRFVAASDKEKIKILKSKKDDVLTKKISFSKENMSKYVSVTSEGKRNRNFIVPMEFDTFYGKGLTYSEKNPNFLSFAFYLSADHQPLLDTLNGEIIFKNSIIHDITGYFQIGNTFGFMGETMELVKPATPINTRLIDIATGETIIPNAETDRNQQANYLFGAPGDIWTGPVHFHPVTNNSDPDFGKTKIMAGASHDSTVPHPFLEYVTKPGNKVCDFRTIPSFEDIFSYKSGRFQRSIANLRGAIYTQQKRQNFIDDLIAKKSIFSQEKMLIRKITKTYNNKAQKTKDNVILFFGIDKKKLLKETTKLPQLLEKLVEVQNSSYSNLTNRMEIFHFEIIRVNKHTGEFKSLIVGDNDVLFNDSSSVNQLNQNISKGFVLENVTDKLALQSNREKGINLYQFTDGELDAKHDDNKYSYEVKIKFRDPLINYLSEQLTRIKKVIKDLDELIYKTNSVMIDPETGRRVRVYDEFQKQLNPTFVSESLRPPGRPVLPLGFSFNPLTQLPRSAEMALKNNSDLESLSLFFIALNSLDSTDSFLANGRVVENPSDYLTTIMVPLLKLETSSPQKIEKARAILDSVRFKAEKLLSIFSAENITKKSSGFTTRDYLESSNISTKEESLVVEFKHSFHKSIDLSKVKDHFDWIEEAAHIGSDGGIKTITPESYKSLVQNKNITNFLTPGGVESFGNENNFSYSFLPYSSPSVLDLHNSDRINLQEDFLQTIRKKIVGNTTSDPDSVLIPEILSNFGIKFIDSKSEKKFNYLEDSRAYSDKQIPLNNAFEDNFGSSFVTKEPKLNDNCSDVITSGQSDFGSTVNPNFEWQGGRFEDYPYNAGMSLVSLLNTRVNTRKDIKFLGGAYQGLLDNGIILNSQSNFANKQLPYSINLMSLEGMASQDSANEYISKIMPLLFNSNNMLRFENYHYYSYLLNIFARVYYLQEFATRSNASFGGNSRKFRATTKQNNSLVKDMNWQPLTLSVINNLQSGRRILCKLMLFDGSEASKILDQKVLNLFKEFYNYNKLFFIARENSTPFVAPESDSPESPPVEIQTESTGARARQLLNNGISLVDNLLSKEETRQVKDTSVEEKAIKEATRLMTSPAFTFEKLIR